MGVLGDFFGTGDFAVDRAKKASQARKVARMRGVSNKVNAGRSIPNADAPHTCGRSCGYLPNGQGCPSTVRGGVCPCRNC